MGFELTPSKLLVGRPTRNIPRPATAFTPQWPHLNTSHQQNDALKHKQKARLRRTSPDGVSTRYDLGVSAGAVTRPCDQLPLLVIQSGEWVEVVSQSCDVGCCNLRTPHYHTRFK